jgi:hypothetical protein
VISDELQELVDRVLATLDAAGCEMRGGGERWRGLCPLCGGRDLTLNVDLGRQRLFLDCWHATCEWQTIHEVLAIDRSDLVLATEPAGGELVRRRFDEITFKRVEFLVPDRVPLQGLTLLVGDPFATKSTWAAGLAAGVTTGAYGAPGVVAILNAEDATEITTGPRVKAAGGNLSLVEELTVRDAEYERVLTLPDDVGKLEAWVEETGARLLVLDPLMMFISERADTNQDHGIRRALASLAMLAERRSMAVLVCAHLNKDEQKRMLYRVGGSIGIVGLARSMLFMTHDPDDPGGDEGNMRLLAHAASNWSARAATLRYRLDVVAWEEDSGELITTTKLELVGVCEYSAEQLIAPTRSREPSKVELAEDAICEALQNGPRFSNEVKAEVLAAVECSVATLQRAAGGLHFTHVITSEGGGPATVWRLLTQPSQSPPRDDEKVGSSLGARGRTDGDTEPSHHPGEGDEKVADRGVEKVAEEAGNGDYGTAEYHARVRAYLEEQLRRRPRRPQ